MKILKVYAKNCLNGKQLVIDESATEEDFIKTIVKEHEKQYYDINKTDLEIADEEEYDEQWNKLFQKTLDKCIEYARKHQVNYFGDYEIVLLDNEECIDSPDIIGTYTFYDEMEEKEMSIINKNKGDEIMEKQTKKNNTQWVIVPNRYLKEFTKTWTTNKEGAPLAQPIEKKCYFVNIPRSNGENLSFVAYGKAQHPQVKDYAIIPIPEEGKYVSFSHLEKGDDGKNVFVKDGDPTRVTQSLLVDMVKDSFKKINDELTKYLIVPKENVEEISFYAHEIDGSKVIKDALKITLPDYMKEYNGHMLAGSTMLAPFQYENTKDENLAVFRIDENATIKLWENGDEKNEFTLTGKELIDLNKSNYKSFIAKEHKKGKEDEYNEFVKGVYAKAVSESENATQEKSDFEEAKREPNVYEQAIENSQNLSTNDTLQANSEKMVSDLENKTSSNTNSSEKEKNNSSDREA